MKGGHRSGRRRDTNQADETAASDGVALAELGAEEGEVEVLEQQYDGGQQHAGRQQDERAGEVENAQRFARLSLGVVLLARTGHPEPLQALHLACTRTQLQVTAQRVISPNDH